MSNENDKKTTDMCRHKIISDFCVMCGVLCYNNKIAIKHYRYDYKPELTPCDVLRHMIENIQLRPCPCPSTKIPFSYLNQRPELVRMLKNLNSKLSFKTQTLFLAVYYMDMILVYGSQDLFNFSFVSNQCLISLCCLIIAAKYEENDPTIPDLHHFQSLCAAQSKYKHLFSLDEFRNGEVICLKALNYYLHHFTAYHFLVFFFGHGIIFAESLTVKSNYADNKKILEKIYFQAREILDIVIEDHGELVLETNSLHLACAILTYSIDYFISMSNLLKENNSNEIFQFVYDINIKSEAFEDCYVKIKSINEQRNKISPVEKKMNIKENSKPETLNWISFVNVAKQLTSSEKTTAPMTISTKKPYMKTKIISENKLKISDIDSCKKENKKILKLDLTQEKSTKKRAYSSQKDKGGNNEQASNPSQNTSRIKGSQQLYQEKIDENIEYIATLTKRTIGGILPSSHPEGLSREQMKNSHDREPEVIVQVEKEKEKERERETKSYSVSPDQKQQRINQLMMEIKQVNSDKDSGERNYENELKESQIGNRTKLRNDSLQYFINGRKENDILHKTKKLLSSSKNSKQFEQVSSSAYSSMTLKHNRVNENRRNMNINEGIPINEHHSLIPAKKVKRTLNFDTENKKNLWIPSTIIINNNININTFISKNYLQGSSDIKEDPLTVSNSNYKYASSYKPSTMSLLTSSEFNYKESSTLKKRSEKDAKSRLMSSESTSLGLRYNYNNFSHNYSKASCEISSGIGCDSKYRRDPDSLIGNDIAGVDYYEKFKQQSHKFSSGKIEMMNNNNNNNNTHYDYALIKKYDPHNNEQSQHYLQNELASSTSSKNWQTNGKYY